MLSIIIPTLNEEKYLPRLLESIRRQSFSDYEIIVSDAGSTDKTEFVAKEAGVIFILSNKIKHPSYQRNAGARVAKGDILLFLDADSQLPENFLIKAMGEFKKRNLTGAGFYIKFNPNRFYYNFYSGISNFICFCKQWGNYPVAVGAGLMSFKNSHDIISGFDPEVRLAEDYDYCYRLSKVGKFRMIKGVRLLYSARRIEKEGFIVSGLKWLHMGFYTLTHQTIKKDIIKYDFGKF
ncbi:MAG: hypothetical protein PWQ35_172 [Patescibacteria group bacterium]|nr:hypothetical protein [Patescibacteria group bacterium]